MRPLLLAVSLFLSLTVAQAADPLRVFIRAGAKTHGPGQHDHPRFLTEWTKLLNDRGARASGGLEFPTGEQLAATDVLVMYCAEGGMLASEHKANLEAFTKRGGGVVVIHDAVCGREADWFKTIVGGAWQHGRAKWWEGEISNYYVNTDHPITAGASNFDLDDEMYYDLDLLPEAQVLAATWTPDKRAEKNGRAFPHIYNAAPQMWTYEKDQHRAFVSIPGHNWKTFELPHYRAVLLRGIAWAGKRTAVDELCSPDELASLRYPAGGPSRPNDAVTKLITHPDFTTKLVASEPLVNKAINVDWDLQGRMWVAETPEYPNGRRGIKPEFAGMEWKDGGGVQDKAGKQDRPATDRISMLTDTDGDGVMDKKSVFADGLELVTGFVLHRDGVIVTAAPDILWLRDTDGDGKADKTEKLYTGLGINDTHAVINNPRWGLDGWVYATHGYSAADVTSADGKKKFGRIGSGVIRFRPDGSAIEQYSSKGGNTWGLQITWDGEVMWTQPTSGDLLLHTVLPEHLLARGKVADTSSYRVVIKSPKSFPAMKWEQQAYRQIDWVGSFTAAAGTAIYDGGTWPKAYDGSYFTTEPTINVVHHQILKEEGVTFAGMKQGGREETEFMGSRDLWFRPIEARVGPDGALYILDFYNQAVIHNDTRGPVHNGVNAAVRPDRDHYFGRILRVDHREAKKAAPSAAVDGDRAEVFDLGSFTKAIQTSNTAQRNNVIRLAVERAAALTDDERAAAQSKVMEAVRSEWSKLSPEAKVAALWTLHRMGGDIAPVLSMALADPEGAVNRNALRIVGEPASAPAGAANVWDKLVLERLREGDPRTRLAAILALGAGVPSAEARTALVAAYPTLTDKHLQSALIGVASKAPADFIVAALAAADVTPLRALVVPLADQVKGDGAAAMALVTRLAPALSTMADRAGAAPVLSVVLEKLAEGAKGGNIPAWSGELEKTLVAYLHSPVAGAALPLAAAWDRSGAMSAMIRELAKTMVAKLAEPALPDAERAALAGTLISLRAVDPGILPAVGDLLGAKSSEAVQRRIVEELGTTSEPASAAVLAKAFAQLSPALQDAAFAQMLKRPEWTRTLLGAIKSGTVPLAGFGPVALDKLRHHPDGAVAQLATVTIDAIRGPMLQQKDVVLAKLLPGVEEGGDIIKGKQLYAGTCAVCHRFNGEGANLAPELTGMGAHPRAELLTHIVDPNREVDPTFAAYNVETKAGETFQGIIVQENAQTILVRDAAGEHEVKKSELVSRREVGRSLMPEGFEALGAEPLRDIIAYLQSADSKYRLIDMRAAFTADSRRGLFISQDDGSSLRFKKHGDVRVGDVPFRIADPGTGRNLVVLRGGDGFAKTGYPTRVEMPVNKVRAGALHFLGGVSGWGHPFGDASREGLPTAKVTVFFEGGEKAELELKNGVEFADYINADFKVPGSEPAKGIVEDGRGMRTFRKTLPREGVIEKIVIESTGPEFSPVFVAITAEVGNLGTDRDAVKKEGERGPLREGAAAPRPPAASAGTPVAAANAPVSGPAGKPAGVRALAVGGGSSHDFGKWFHEAGQATLGSLAPGGYEYSEKTEIIGTAAANTDVLYLSTNQPISSEARQGIFAMANAGKGLLLVHPALWYNWSNFPEYNRELAGGGSRGHDAYGEFEVEVLDRTHPVTAGLPERFRITDELYYFIPDPQGTPIQVLAQATSPKTGKTFPMIWITKHPKARIACITLGHDGKAHELPEFKRLLQNAFRWTSGANL